MPPTEYQESRADVRWKLLGSLLFVVFGLVMAAFPKPFHPLPGIAVRAAGVVVVLFFAMGVAMWASTLRTSGADLVVSDEGVVHRFWGRLDWDEVLIVQTWVPALSVPSQRFIEVIPLDPDAFVSRMTLPTRLWARLNARTGMSPFAMGESTLAVPYEQVLADLQQRHQRFLER
jgi:hypothetical protein